MTGFQDEQTLEADDEQLTMLRELGVEESRLEGLSYADAEDLIAELRAMREDAGRIGNA